MNLSRVRQVLKKTLAMVRQLKKNTVHGAPTFEKTHITKNHLCEEKSINKHHSGLCSKYRHGPFIDVESSGMSSFLTKKNVIKK